MVERTEVFFDSDDVECAGYLYRPAELNGKAPCVVMGHGFSGTRDLGLSAYAERFAAAGMSVLVFDYRHFGASAGRPRQVVHVARQQEDYRAAIRFARELEGVDPERVALWGTSFSGSHAIVVAATDPRIAAIVAQVPGLSGSLKIVLKLVVAGARDALGALMGRQPYLVPAVGDPGDGAIITDPEGKAILEALAGEGSLWRNEVALRGIFGGAEPRPKKLKMPLLVCVADHDRVAPPSAAWRAARRAPRGEVRRYPVDHFAVYHGEVREQVIDDQLDFLCTHLLYKPRRQSAERGPTVSLS